MSEGNAAVEVTQGDWELAADVLGYENYNQARRDGHIRQSLRNWAQKLARHRLSATTSDETARLREFQRAMMHACDRTTAHKKGVIVEVRDWHRLMDLARDVRAALQSQDIPS